MSTTNSEAHAGDARRLDEGLKPSTLESDMQELGRTLGLCGLILFGLGGICYCFLLAAFLAEKAKGGYSDYVGYVFRNPGAFFTFVFRELKPDDWRKRLVIPWIVLCAIGTALIVAGAVIDPTS